MNKQLQKVIDGLRHHIGLSCWEHSDEYHTIRRCPYYDDEDNGEPACGTKLLLDTIELLKEYDSALRSMVYQYCTIERQYLFNKNCENPEEEIFFNDYMSAGEEAFRVLEIDNFQEVPEDWLDE